MDRSAEDRPVAFRRVEPEEGTPAPTDAVSGARSGRAGNPHRLRSPDPRPGEAHVETFCEEHVDGFKTDEPTWVAYCPDCGAKLALREHEACPFFSGPAVDDHGFTVGVQCGLTRREPPA